MHAYTHTHTHTHSLTYSPTICSLSTFLLSSATDNSYTRYFPLLYINELSVLDRSLLVSGVAFQQQPIFSSLSLSLSLSQQVTKDNTTMPLTISYSPIGLGQLRIWVLLRKNMETMRTFGEQYNF